MEKIVIDIDSTIYPLITAMSKFNSKVNYDALTGWDVLPELCGDKEGQKPIKMFELFDLAMSKETMIEIGTFNYASEAINELNNRFEIHIMTSRPDGTENVIASYLEFYNIPFQSLTVKHKLDKVQVCKELGINKLIDDNPKEINAAVESGIEIYSLRFLHNQDCLNYHKTPWACHKTEGWEKLVRFIN